MARTSTTMRFAIFTQLAVIGLVPASVPRSYVTVPISFVAAMPIGLFRTIGDLAYLPVATTGNLVRLVEAGYATLGLFIVDERKGIEP